MRAPLAALVLCAACSSSSNVPDAPPARCALVAPSVDVTTSVEHCGVKPHRWLASEKLGEITREGARDHFSATANAVILAVGNARPPGELHDVDLEQIGYLTQDRGETIEATTLVAYPSDLDAKTTFDVVLVLHGTAGFTDACAPSSGGDTRPLVAALASLGYVAVAPDYIGLRGLGPQTGFAHPYLVGQPTAISSLDAVRAATRLLARSEVPVCASTRFAVIGGSQGGHAALWIDRLAPYYAKELENVGVVATVPPADMLGEGVRALRTRVPASGNIAAFFGAASDWYGVRAKLSDVFVSPLDVELPKELAASCDPGASYEDKELAAVFTKPLLDAAAGDGLRALSPWGCMLTENGLTTTSIARVAPKSPSYDVLFVLGENDTLVDPETERKSFDTLCAQGMSMHYLECAGASHTQATTWSLPEIIEFVRDRFAGKTPDAATACKRAAAVTCRGKS